MSGEEEVRERLADVSDFLKAQSAFDGDSLSWAARCITEFLNGQARTLDHAFGLIVDKRQVPMKEGVHDDWVAAAFLHVIACTPKGKEWPDTNTLAEIGRYFGLGGKDPANAENHGIASELKRIIERYRSIIVRQLGDELTAKRRETGG